MQELPFDSLHDAIAQYYNSFIDAADEWEDPLAWTVSAIMQSLANITDEAPDQSKSMLSELEEAIEQWKQKYCWGPLDRFHNGLFQSWEQEKTQRRARAESPIEIMFIDAMDHSGYEKDMHVQYTGFPPYRLDVAFPDYKVAVELDGHQYHSSKEARIRDAGRDRALTIAGWQVVRFTGSDIHRNVNQCRNELILILDNAAESRGMPRMFPDAKGASDMGWPSYDAILWQLNKERN